ncbi:prophage MuSo1, positive regulator of late transcription, putative [Shewanella sp. W3-18-1]|nr:prophage MuSo1, positive regulator of late transcription, putative [Shewanella sp. W3-18-1]
MRSINEQIDSMTTAQSNIFKSKWPENLVALSDVIDACLAEEKVVANKLTEKIITSIAFYLGGRDLYLPNGKSLEMFLRNLRIYQEFNGRNKAELARKYSMTERNIDKITEDLKALYRYERNKGAEFKGK